MLQLPMLRCGFFVCVRVSGCISECVNVSWSDGQMGE